MKPKTVAQARKNMIKYLKNQGNYKISDFKGMSYDEIRPIFEKVWDFNQHIEPIEHETEKMKSPEKMKCNNPNLRGSCGKLDAQPIPPYEGDMVKIRPWVNSGHWIRKHVNVLGTCGELDAFVSIPDEGDMTFLHKKGKSGAAVGKLVLLHVFVHAAHSQRTALVQVYCFPSMVLLHQHDSDAVQGTDTLQGTVISSAAVNPDLERKSDETEEVNIKEKEASNVKSGDTEELDLETTQSTARQSTITPRTLNFEDEAGPSSPLRPIQVMESEEQLNADEVSCCFLDQESIGDYKEMRRFARKIQAEWDAEEEERKKTLFQWFREKRDDVEEREAKRLLRKRKATIAEEQPSKKPKLRTETIDELRNYLRVVDFEKNAQDLEVIRRIVATIEIEDGTMIQCWLKKISSFISREFDDKGVARSCYGS
ncbi:hypothetical protein Tco_0341732 [Tanacetum coccineum]